MPTFISRVLSFALRLVFWLFAAVFALSLLSASLVLVALGLLKSLFTGKKPKPAMVFGRFQRFASKDRWPGAPMRGAAAPPEAQVVDVQVREICDDKRPP